MEDKWDMNDLESSDWSNYWEYFLYTYVDIRIQPIKFLLTYSYYEWLFHDLSKYSFRKSLTKFFCRIKDHPNGPIWYCQGLEPDMRCQDCLDYIG